MREKLTKVFGSSPGLIRDVDSEVNVKVEELNLVEDEEDYYYEDVLYGGSSQFRGRGPRGGRLRSNFSNRGVNRQQGTRNRGSNRDGRIWRGAQQRNPHKARCHICESINHFAADCPDRAYFCEDEE